MKDIYERCCGLDVHRDTIVGCILLGYGDFEKKEIKTFSTKTYGLNQLIQWLRDNKILHVVVESTGVYWRPIFNLCEGEFDLVLANAYRVKNGKGKKTDVKDCEWLCRLLKAGAIDPSFIPPKEIRRLREIVRYRRTLIWERGRIKNRIIKILEGANYKLSSVFTDVFGYTSWLIITKIINGVRCVRELTSYIDKRCKSTLKEIQEALEGTLKEEDLTILTHLNSQAEYLNQKIEDIEKEIDILAKPYGNEIDLLMTIPGVSKLGATVIISEIGVDMSCFPTHAKLASWAAICPGNNESAGKSRSGRTRRGNNYLKSALVQAAWAAARTKNTYLQSKFRALAARKGSKRAIIAIGHKMIVACYYMLKDKKEFKELGPKFLDNLNESRKVKYHVKRLEELGYHVSMVEKVKDEIRELVLI